MGLAPENSLEGFILAIDKGVEWVELDVRVSKDGKAVVIHDDSLQRLASNSKKVADMTMDELLAIRLHSGASICSLQKALEALSKSVGLMIELKTVQSADAVEEALRAQTKTQSHIVVTSFSAKALSEFHKRMPEVPTAKLRRWWPFVSERMRRRCGIQFVGLRRNWVHRSIITQLHRKGLKVYAYTIDDQQSLARAEKAGLDMVVRNSL